MLSPNTSSAPIRLLSKQMFLTTLVWEVAVVQVAVWVEAWAKGWEIVQELINNGSLVELEYHGKKFYTRNLSIRSSAGERRKSS